jgi:hypothetical protein
MIVQRPMAQAVFIVTDIECDGPSPGVNSMLAFASVAVTAEGEEKGVFEAVLEPLPDAHPDPETWAWFQTQPVALAAATKDPRSPADVMADYVDWLGGFQVGRTFTSYPLALDGPWIDHYLRRFTPYAVTAGHYAKDRLFDGSGLCLKSFAAGLLGRDPWDCNPKSFPPAWLGGHAHSHRAIDDARGYAHLLGVLMAMSKAGRRP